MMMKRMVLAALAVSLIGCGGGQRKTEAVATKQAVPAEKPAAARPLLWVVKGEKGSIWMYGTIHTGGAELVPKAAWDALAGAKEFVMETDLDSVDQNALLQRAMLPPGQTLDQMLEPEVWTKLVELVKPFGLPAEALKRFKPWFVVVAVEQAMVPPGEATDMALRKKAKDAGLTLDYLETWQEQLDALEAGTDVAQLEDLVMHAEEHKKSLDQLVDAYKRGDAELIAQMSRDPDEMTPVALERLLLARNRNWIPKIEQFLESGGGVFVAVGAAHLPGEGGVLDLLQKRGYQVTRVE